TLGRARGANLDRVRGTGGGGRVTKDAFPISTDGRRGAPAAPAPAPVAPAPAPPAPAPLVTQAPAPAPPAPAGAPGDRVTIEPMSNMRRKIAENMLNSLSVSAHVTSFFEVDFTNIARLRERVKKQFEEQHG